MAIRRIDCKVLSNRSRKPTESPSQGSSSVAPLLGWVTILRWVAALRGDVEIFVGTAVSAAR